jgi:folate-binding Fe-S cluster repair protein YgfZ
MVLWKEWLALAVEKSWQEEELKEERKYLFRQKLDQKNNDLSIIL